MIKVHHLENSRSQRVLWLLEELGLQYEVVRYRRDPATMLAPPELRQVHPLGKSPVLEEEGLVLAESGAIIEYLAEKHDQAHRLSPPPGPADDPERLRYRQWLHYAEGSLMPPLLLSLVFSRIRQAPMPFFAKPIARGIADKTLKAFVRPQIKLHMDYIEAELGKHPWFAGERFSAADIQMSFPVEAATARSGAGGYPNLQRFLQRIRERPGYQRAVERGGALEPLQ
ncbi:glutathione S-transferase family protein [Novilysobacter erysipheiresistens]|uniref:Glutathione S-transferase n=1 Tax=Novilysobacter erysipheiresistens TaxID=1749332 RepID=A0ABU7Z1A0_9GAMM